MTAITIVRIDQAHVRNAVNSATAQRLHDEFIGGQGLRMAGKHHEIYLSDFRRVAPGKQRTILRQPVAAAGE